MKFTKYQLQELNGDDTWISHDDIPLFDSREEAEAHGEYLAKVNEEWGSNQQWRVVLYSTPERPLNNEGYYTWEIDNGELTINSECCADTFSAEELEKLRKVLNEL